MKRIILIAIGVAILILLSATFYNVDETEQVIITQFGKPIGGAIDTPGLKVKLPFIQDVHRFDKRWLAWDGDANQITTKDKKFIWVDTYARWRIADPLKYFQSVRDERGAQSRLDDIIDGETRNAVAAFDLIEIVRSTSREFELTEELQEFAGQEAALEITAGREEIAKVILDKSSEVTPNFGIELVDVKFKHLNYVDEVRTKVYERMISERQRIAERSRSQAEEIRGDADAEATNVYARAYSKDPDFYQFMKTLETYRSSFDDDVTLILTSDSEFLSFLKKSR
jgi:membrane protease subunit HflC